MKRDNSMRQKDGERRETRQKKIRERPRDTKTNRRSKSGAVWQRRKRRQKQGTVTVTVRVGKSRRCFARSQSERLAELAAEQGRVNTTIARGETHETVMTDTFVEKNTREQQDEENMKNSRKQRQPTKSQNFSPGPPRLQQATLGVADSEEKKRNKETREKKGRPDFKEGSPERTRMD